MGLRGPGAKPKAEKTPQRGKPEDDGQASFFAPVRTAQKPAEPQAWERDSLSRAERVIAFCEALPVTAGSLAGHPMGLRPWQRDIIEAIYAVDERGRRPVRTCLLTMPRKNGKTAIAAVLALAHLVGPEAEQRGQIYSAAADRDQAAIIFREMKAIVELVPWMEDRVVVRDFSKEFEDVKTGSIYRALSSDAKTKHGFSASFIVYDELAQAPNRHLYDVLTTSTAARAEPLTVVISTMSPDPNHVMSELVEYGRQLNAGIVQDPTFKAIIYAAPLDADPWDEAVWHAANPALGDFRSLPEMRTAALQAQRIPAKEGAFKNLYLNMAVEADERYIAHADWQACMGKVDAEALAGRPCWAGLDLSSTRDLSAVVLFFPHDDGQVLPFFWCPAEQLDRREDEDKVPYRTWSRSGLIETTPGRAINKRSIALRLAELSTVYEIRGVAYDRWGMDEMQRILDEEGISLPLKPFGQGYKDQGPAVSALEAVVLDRQLRHDGHPVLTWCLSNVVIDTDPAGARKFTKERAKERIDGAVALAMAVGLHAREPGEQAFVIDAEDLVIAI